MSFVNRNFLLCILWVLILDFGCSKGQLFDPDFRVADHTLPGIVSENGEVIPANDIRFDNFACMSKEKIKELKQILMRTKSPAYRSRVVQEYLHLTERMSKN